MTEPADDGPANTGSAWPVRLAWAVVVIGAAMVVVGGTAMVRSHRHHASVAAGPITTVPATLPAVSGPFAPGRHPLHGFGEVAVKVRMASGATKVLCMMLAHTLPQQERGLMTVTDPTLGGYDGMLFAFSADTQNGFWMSNTPMALSIAYLDHRGHLVSKTDMAPCADIATCPTYPAAGPYRMAVEVPKGRLAGLGIGPQATVQEDGACSARS